MGIQGLLPLLKSIHKPTHLRNFSGQTLGIDAYGWLHRGTVACAIDLAKGEPTRKHIDFALHRVRMLIHFGVKPYLVFDGDYLPSKAHTEKERAARRKESKRAGLELLRMGRSSAAQLELQKAVDVTPAMARELIEELKRLDVPYVVAPYEADSQLAYLEKKGIIDGVLSEDSDLLVFGVQCLLTKLDQYGECVMINRKDFTACRDVSLVGWTDKEFRMMAMLSGCDYLPGIDKMGLKTAYRLVRKHKTVERVIRTVQFDGKMKVPPGYLEAFQKAERTFLYPWVFCPETRQLLNLHPLPASVKASSLPYIGKHVEPELAAGVACGDLDPNTKEPIPVPQQYRFRHPATISRVVQTPNEKPEGVPITDFFKRVPLAELDPNSFTPSPSQQRLLQFQENTSWSASQIPVARVFGQSRSIIPPPPSSAPHLSRRSVTNPFPAARRGSPKRQRLCSDSTSIATAMGSKESLEDTTSPFFPKPSIKASPSVRRKSTRTQTEFELWSDDSALDALNEAAASVESTQNTNVLSPRKRKKLQVFADSQVTDVDDSAGDTSQDSITTTATYDSQAFPGLDTPDTSFEIMDSPSQSQGHSTIGKGARKELDSSRFARTTPVRRAPTRRISAPIFASTPLQFVSKLEPAAELKEPSSPEKPATGEIIPNSSPPVSHAAEMLAEDSINDHGTEAPEPSTNLLHGSSTLCIKGSEDMIVPESPETVEGANSSTRLSLGKFMFRG